MGMDRRRLQLPRFRRLACLTALLAAGCQGVGTVSPPSQPATGPGGADYTHSSVIAQRFGEGADEYWLFLPDDPMPERAPFVVFLHGWAGMDPRVYGGWIQHIVRKGHIVVYPRYQTNARTKVSVMVAAAAGAVQDAWNRLDNEGPIQPVQERIAWVGHSLGATFAAKLAAASADYELPPAGALLVVQPGAVDRVGLDGLDRLPTDALVSLVVGDADYVVGDDGATAIMDALVHVPASQIEMVTVQSDRRSRPALVADHFSPLSTVASFPPDPSNEGAPAYQRRRSLAALMQQRPPDALDYFAFWKLCDGLLDATFRQRNLEYAFGDTAKQRYMGLLSDGTPVTPLLVNR